MNASPDEFRKYLTGAHAVNGPDIPDRPNHSIFTDSCRQDGLTDAARGIFDKHSFTSRAPMTFEHRCSSWLGFAFAKAIDKRHDDLYVARDIAARTHAAFVQVQGQRHQMEDELREVEEQIGRTRTVLDDPQNLFYEPLTDVLTTPHHEAALLKNPRTASTPWHQPFGDLGSWIRDRPWKKIVLWLALVAGEIGLIFALTQDLGDDPRTGQLLALSLSAMAVGIAWLAVPPLLESGTSRGRKVVSWIALTLYVLSILPLGWLRSIKTRPDVQELVYEATRQADMPRYGDILLYMLWVALPLGLTAVIALLETNRQDDQRSVSTSLTPQTNARLVADKHHRRKQNQLINHLTDLLARRQQLTEAIIFLKAEEAQAQAAREDVQLNESAIDERARLYLQSLPEMISDGFLCYLKGLEQGLGDPTMTAYIQEAAQTFLSRYIETAETKINEYLVYLDEHPLFSPVRVPTEETV